MQCRYLPVALVVLCLSFIHAEDRLPIPDEAAQKQAADLVKEVFGKEIADAKTQDKQAALVKKLLEEATRPDTSAEGRHALLTVALDHAPDASVAVSVVDEMAKHFQIDPLREKASVVWRKSKSAKTSLQFKSVAEVALQLVDQSVKRDAYDPAIKLAEIAFGAAQAAKDGKLVSTVKAKALETRRNKADFAKVQEAMVVLEKEPTNAEANSTVGNYRCLVKEDWEAGLPMLALGNDESLKELAIRELRMPTKSDEQVALGDGWYDLAQKSSETIKDRVLQRAGFWYQLSLKSGPDLPRLVKVKVEKRLSEMLESVPVEGVSSSKEPSNKDALTKISFLSSFVTEGKVSLGQWQFKDGKLMGWATPKAAKIKIGEVPFEQYDLLVDFVLLKRKDDGVGDLIFHLPRVGASMCLRRTKSNRTIIGFWVSGNLEDSRVSSIFPGRLVLGKPYRLLVRIRGDGSKLEILLDGKQVKSLAALPGVNRSSPDAPLQVTLSPNLQVVLGKADVIDRSEN